MKKEQKKNRKTIVSNVICGVLFFVIAGIFLYSGFWVKNIDNERVYFSPDISYGFCTGDENEDLAFSGGQELYTVICTTVGDDDEKKVTDNHDLAVVLMSRIQDESFYDMTLFMDIVERACFIFSAISAICGSIYLIHNLTR